MNRKLAEPTGQRGRTENWRKRHRRSHEAVAGASSEVFATWLHRPYALVQLRSAWAHRFCALFALFLSRICICTFDARPIVNRVASTISYPIYCMDVQAGAGGADR